jgi:hypothetical protein
MTPEVIAIAFRVPLDDVVDTLLDDEYLDIPSDDYAEPDVTTDVDLGGVTVIRSESASTHLDAEQVEELVRGWASNNIDQGDLDLPLCSMTKTAVIKRMSGSSYSYELVAGYNHDVTTDHLEQITDLNREIVALNDANRTQARTIEPHPVGLRRAAG